MSVACTVRPFTMMRRLLVKPRDDCDAAIQSGFGSFHQSRSPLTNQCAFISGGIARGRGWGEAADWGEV